MAWLQLDISYLGRIDNKMKLQQLQNKFEDVLNEQFPKGKCKERGNALVLFSIMWIEFEKLEKKRKYWEEHYKKCQ